MQSLIKFAVNRKITILMLVAAILLLGAVSWSRTPVDLFPNITYPGAAVIASYPGAAPEEVELYVTRPLEGALGGITNIQEISSFSQEGQAIIILRFNWGVDMDAAAIDIREKLDQVTRLLPSEVMTPTIYKFDPSMMPIMGVAVSSGQVDMVELRRLGTEVSRRLERIPGLASVSVSGGLEEEIAVTVDRVKLEEFSLSLANITNSLRAANINLPGGSVTENDNRWLIRTLVRTQTLEELQNLLVGVRQITIPGQAAPTMAPVYLKDVAEVNLQPQPQTVITRVNQKPNISLSLNKRSDANTVLTANLVRAELDQLAIDFPQLTFTPTDDQSLFILQTINSLGRNAVFGGILALVVLLLFLRSIRSTLIIGLSIPVSVVSTFILMYFTGLTINMMTLAGLALGIGMLVDNSIVVIENIYRHLQEGLPRKEAALKGAGEVAMAITASTLTTVAVFLPVVFVGGLTGILFKELAMTVSFSLLASLVVALTFIPMLSGTIAKGGAAPASRFNIAPLYRRALAGALKGKVPVLLVVLALVATSAFLAPRLGAEFIPAFDEGSGSISIILANDATLADTEALVTQVEALLLSEPDMEIVSSTIGGGSQGGMGSRLGVGAMSQVNRAQVSFQLKPVEQRSLSTIEFMDKLKEKLPQVEGATIELREQQMAAGGMFGGRSLEVELTGYDLERMGNYAEQLAAAIANLGYVEEATNSLAQQNPELQVRVDLEKTSLLGLSPILVANAIRSAFQGETATRLTRDGYELAVMVRLQEEQRSSIQDILDTIVFNQGGRLIRVSDLASLEETAGPRSISRRNNQRYVTVSAILSPEQDLQSARRDVEALIADLNLPADYSAAFTGQVREMEDAFSGMVMALLLAMALVYMVMASQFESLVHPFTVMFTLPLAAVGVIFTLFITASTISIPALIGIVVLAGIVVNNAIVLIDYINQLRGRGQDVHEAVLNACQVRLRPILMTTLTTVLGLLPLALITASGSEMQRPLALTVVGGLTIGAFLTLFIIPIIYTIVDRIFPKATLIQNQEDVF